MNAVYHRFARYYDELNSEADYDRLFAEIDSRLSARILPGNILADLGCGTGELTVRFASRKDRDLIAVDGSEEMLSILAGKCAEIKLKNVLILQQDLTRLDLYGSIHSAVCTFDTLNHLGPESQMRIFLQRVGLFMEKDGVFVFDFNTRYKHLCILGDNRFDLDAESVRCVWKNKLEAEFKRSLISLEFTEKATGITNKESFYEYYIPEKDIDELCRNAGFRIVDIADGETFGLPSEHSQRLMITAEKAVQTQRECSEGGMRCGRR